MHESVVLLYLLVASSVYDCLLADVGDGDGDGLTDSNDVISRLEKIMKTRVKSRGPRRTFGPSQGPAFISGSRTNSGLLSYKTR